jgi:hypothetical protein
MRAAGEKVHVRQAKSVEVVTESFGFAEAGGFKTEPDEAAGFKAREFPEMVIGLVEAGESVGPGEGGKFAVERVAPRMIGADQ